MKRLALLLLAVTLTACESSREVNGKSIPCYGLNGDPQPSVKYEYSTRNIIVAALTLEFVVPVIIVTLEEAKCPKAA